PYSDEDSPGAQTERRGLSGPVRVLLGGETSPAGFFWFSVPIATADNSPAIHHWAQLKRNPQKPDPKLSCRVTRQQKASFAGKSRSTPGLFRQKLLVPHSSCPSRTSRRARPFGCTGSHL